MDLTLELIVVPVTDVDRAKAFYSEQLGFVVDVDHTINDEYRVVQLTPPGSACSIAIGKGLSTGVPGSMQGLQLCTLDIDATRADLVGRGVDVTPVRHFENGDMARGARRYAGTRSSRSRTPMATAGSSRRSRRMPDRRIRTLGPTVREAGDERTDRGRGRRDPRDPGGGVRDGRGGTLHRGRLAARDRWPPLRARAGWRDRGPRLGRGARAARRRPAAADGLRRGGRGRAGPPGDRAGVAPHGRGRRPHPGPVRAGRARHGAPQLLRAAGLADVDRSGVRSAHRAASKPRPRTTATSWCSPPRPRRHSTSPARSAATGARATSGRAARALTSGAPSGTERST